MLFARLLTFFALSLTYLAATATHIPVTGPSAIVEIQQTLNLFPISVDTKDYTILADIFTTDATADFAVVPVVHGLKAIQDGLAKSLEGLVSQHSFTTQSITIHNKRKASAITYLIGTFFGQKNYTGQIVSNYGQYRDDLRFIDGTGWRVDNRTLVNTGTIGNPDILKF